MVSLQGKCRYLVGEYEGQGLMLAAEPNRCSYAICIKVIINLGQESGIAQAQKMVRSGFKTLR